jgi:hypothetical protein
VANEPNGGDDPDPLDSPPDPDDVPEHLDDLIHAIGIYVPENVNDAEKELYDRIQQGRCMACGGYLGRTTIVVVSRVGIVMLFCQGACLQDMSVQAWLQEQYDDIVSALKFRGNLAAADTAPDTDADDEPPDAA